MGHINHDALKRMVKEGAVRGVKLDLTEAPEFCEACLKAKASRRPFPKESTTRYTKYGEKIVTDLWGPVKVESLARNHYYNLYHDLSSSEERVYFLKLKSQAFASYKKYEAWVKL